jgi:cell fate (sporulation/competence/biofilm development) regulator YmcA (YheA/YmcA/DUF963 family)
MQDKAPLTLNAYHWHEALDRTCTCMKMIDQLILHHPVVEQHNMLEGKVAQARALLLEVCQEVARLSLDETQ